MPKIIFPSAFLKAHENVIEGDVITFINAGKQDKDKRWIFEVRVERTQEEKLFSLNKTNFNAIVAIYGDNSDSWVGKRMKVRFIKRENQKGEEVDAIRLYDPTKTKEELEEPKEISGEEPEDDNPLL